MNQTTVQVNRGIVDETPDTKIEFVLKAVFLIAEPRLS